MGQRVLYVLGLTRSMRKSIRNLTNKEVEQQNLNCSGVERALGRQVRFSPLILFWLSDISKLPFFPERNHVGAFLGSSMVLCTRMMRQRALKRDASSVTRGVGDAHPVGAHVCSQAVVRPWNSTERTTPAVQRAMLLFTSLDRCNAPLFPSFLF
ncbi:hypothetical protein TRVL_08471 [Trypanosoma vivax]|nr:hypothetical protein TRVL_08471 [Trypanosoma vivax]